MSDFQKFMTAFEKVNARLGQEVSKNLMKQLYDVCESEEFVSWKARNDENEKKLEELQQEMFKNRNDKEAYTRSKELYDIFRETQQNLFTELELLSASTMSKIDFDSGLKKDSDKDH